MTWSLLAVLAAAVPARANDLEGMFGNSEPPFEHSTGLYAFLPPGGWNCQQQRDSSVQCQASSTGAMLRIEHWTIEGQLDSELMAFNEERKLQKLPHFRKNGGGRLLLGDVKASIRSFVFDYQGNAEYPVAVEELYVVSGGKAIRVHFEVMARAMPSHARDLKQLYDTFGVAEVDALGQVVTAARPRNAPGQRKKGPAPRGGPPAYP
ncbi:MAG: hypothetical protein HY904_22585 [Deltaproteobacteria bacterium]|nr:hypothetical protein [Deltaproteobacteria bacterium]